MAPLARGALRLVERGVQRLRISHRRYHRVSQHTRPRLALLASSHHRMDRARSFMGRSGICIRRRLETLVLGALRVPAALELRRGHQTRQLHACRHPGRAVHLRCDAVDRFRSVAVPSPGDLVDECPARMDVSGVGGTPSRLSGAPRPRRLAPVGLLPRHPVRARRRDRDPPARELRPRQPPAVAHDRPRATLAADGPPARGRATPPLARAARRDGASIRRGKDAARPRA